MKWSIRERTQHIAERIVFWGYPITRVEVRRAAWKQKHLGHARWLSSSTLEQKLALVWIQAAVTLDPIGDLIAEGTRSRQLPQAVSA